MGPDIMLFAREGDIVCTGGKPKDSVDPWFIALLTMVDFPPTFIQRTSEDWQKKISEYPLNVTDDGVRKNLSYVREKRSVPREHWWFVEAVLRADPNDRPGALELLTHPWLQTR